jgi:hypothetical protein
MQKTQSHHNRMTVKEILLKDNQDQDLNNYKQQLLGELNTEEYKEGERKCFYLISG